MSGEASESGPDVDKRLRSSFRYFRLDRMKPPDRMLVLGVAGGNIIRIFKEYYPKLMIDAVDIDAMMIEAGKKYFDLDRYDRTEYIISDAFLFVRKAVRKARRYDVIFIDLYLGFGIPEYILNEKFLRQVYKILKPKGTVFINHSYYGGMVHKAKQLLSVMRPIFTAVESYAIDRNIEIIASK
jgi:spermidine synthase